VTTESEEGSTMIFEIRNYHYEPSLIKEYRKWAVELALPFLRENLDVVGFWMNLDETPQVSGKPLDGLGSATVTWIIRWADMTQRNEVMARVFASSEWQEVMKQNPGQEHYHRKEAKFAEAL
jgi:hypothetical protein